MDQNLVGNIKDRYRLEEQVGFLLRLAGQRHAIIFQQFAPMDLTPTQFSAMVQLAKMGECSQNELGRRTAMDVATIKGVIDRLRQRGLVEVKPDPTDKRRSLLSLGNVPRDVEQILHAAGARITKETLKPLTAAESKTLQKLLRKIT